MWRWVIREDKYLLGSRQLLLCLAESIIIGRLITPEQEQVFTVHDVASLCKLGLCCFRRPFWHLTPDDAQPENLAVDSIVASTKEAFDGTGVERRIQVQDTHVFVDNAVTDDCTSLASLSFGSSGNERAAAIGKESETEDLCRYNVRPLLSFFAVLD